MSRIGHVIAGRYELRDVLGRGGMATVYRAYQAALDRFVAIKLIDPRLASDNQFAERFRLEARIAASLRHPHILAIFDFGDDNGTLYLVTELIEGGTLQEQLGRFNSFVGVIDLIDPIGQALDFAHARGIVHRDVKPANIFLEGSRPILADFGIAKVLRDATDVGLTATGAGIGTPEYMAPEQLLGQSVDGRADLYALATIVYRLLTSRLPYRLDGPDDTSLALVMRKVNTSPPLPSGFNPAISPTLDAILLRALSRDPAERYPNAAAFLGALRGALGLRPKAALTQPSATTTPLPFVAGSGATGAATVQTDTFVPAPAPPDRPQPSAAPRPVRERRSTTPFILGAIGALALLILVVAGGALALSRGGAGTPNPTSASRSTATLPVVAAASVTATLAPTQMPTPAATVATSPSPTLLAASAASPTATEPTPAPATPTANATPRPSPTPTSRVLPTPTPGAAPTTAPTASTGPTITPAGPTTTAPPVANVRATVQGAILSLPGTSSGVFVDLTNNANNYSDDPDRVFPAASLIKLPIAGAAYQRVAEGQWQPSDRFTLTDADKAGGTGILRNQPAGTSYTLDRMIEIMLLYSDNTAANMLVDRLGGFEAVNAFSRSQGMNSTVMRRKLNDLAAQGRGIDNTTTAGDIARYFLRLHGGELIDGLTSDRLRTILVQRGRDDKNWALLNLPPDTIALHMTGTSDNQRNDAILVTAGEKQYLLVLMANDPNDAGIEAALARVSATIYGAVVGR